MIANVHFHAFLAENGVKTLFASCCQLAPVIVKEGERLPGEFAMALKACWPGAPDSGTRAKANP